MKDGRRWLCRLGFHSEFWDSAIFYSVKRCCHCPAVENQFAARRLAREREIWAEELALGTIFLEVLGRVAQRLFSIEELRKSLP
jgi:hypothetical protein